LPSKTASRNANVRCSSSSNKKIKRSYNANWAEMTASTERFKRKYRWLSWTPCKRKSASISRTCTQLTTNWTQVLRATYRSYKLSSVRSVVSRDLSLKANAKLTVLGLT
jgi:hypothetical protein